MDSIDEKSTFILYIIFTQNSHDCRIFLSNKDLLTKEIFMLSRTGLGLQDYQLAVWFVNWAIIIYPWRWRIELQNETN